MNQFIVVITLAEELAEIIEQLPFQINGIESRKLKRLLEDVIVGSLRVRGLLEASPTETDCFNTPDYYLLVNALSLNERLGRSLYRQTAQIATRFGYDGWKVRLEFFDKLYIQKE